jgi:integrase
VRPADYGADPALAPQPCGKSRPITQQEGRQKAEYSGIGQADPEAIRRRRASANRTLTVLKAALNRAWRDGKIPSDEPWRRVEPFEEADAARIRYLTIGEAKRLLNACDPDFRRLAQAALGTGARYGELAALRASDFNPHSGTIHVRTSKSGKGRHIVLNDEGVALFRSLAAGKPGDAVLLTKADAAPWKPAHQARPMVEACKRAKIAPPVSFHVLRHTWASLAVMAGGPLMVVARNLGHSDTRMVEKHYGHLAPSYVADAIRAAAPKFGIKPERKVVSFDARS